MEAKADNSYTAKKGTIFNTSYGDDEGDDDVLSSSKRASETRPSPGNRARGTNDSSDSDSQKSAVPTTPPLQSFRGDSSKSSSFSSLQYLEGTDYVAVSSSSSNPKSTPSRAPPQPADELSFERE